MACFVSTVELTEFGVERKSVGRGFAGGFGGGCDGVWWEKGGLIRVNEFSELGGGVGQVRVVHRGETPTW
jgi:hypothetical protein